MGRAQRRDVRTRAVGVVLVLLSGCAIDDRSPGAGYHVEPFSGGGDPTGQMGGA